MPESNVHVGPSDYVPEMTDRKWCYIRMEGTTFGNVPLNCELKLEVWDSPNSAGVVMDAIRCAKLALDRGLSGALVGPSSYFMKTPPKQFTDAEARALTEEFIDGNSVAFAADGNGATPGSAPVSGAGEGVLAFVDLSNHECTRMNTNFVGRLIRSLPLTHLSGLQSNLRRPRSELCVRRR